MSGQFSSAATTNCTSEDKCGQLPTISVVIKALNEEAKIGRCIESALAALSEVPNPSEVILADSVSSDRTVEVARAYPITIVQFERISDRGHGAGVQLGFQHARGDFVMLLDGDMELLPGFLERALARLTAEPSLAGVAGLLQEASIVNAFDRRRVTSGASNRPQRSARWLNGGGLYRRIAITEAGGYAADRNLKGWEEAELGMRLTQAGWFLERIDFCSTLHTGHAVSTWELLRSSWRSRRAMANGVLLKQSFGKPWMLKAVTLMLLPLLLILMWAVGFIVLGVSIYSQRWPWAIGFGLTVVAFMIALATYKRSVTQAFVALGMWHYMAAALLVGLRIVVTDPKKRIDSVELSPNFDAVFPVRSALPRLDGCSGVSANRLLTAKIR